MYKTRFKRWGLWKYTRAADIPQILKAKTDRVAEQKPTEVFLHGKRVDLDKVERYLRRRGSIRRQIESGVLYVQSTSPASSHPMGMIVRRRPPDSRGVLLSPISPVSPALSFSAFSLVSTTSPVSSPTYLAPPTSLRVLEETYRAITDYYDSCFAGGRWLSVSPVNKLVYLSTATDPQDGNKRLSEFHQRFKLAFRLLQAPAQTGPEGMKMTRVCFAELPDVLAGEDPTMLYCILDLVRRLREGGMDFLAVQLLRYLDGLAAPKAGGRGHAMSGIWRHLLLGLEGLGPEQTMQCAQIAASRFAAHLGEHHIKTVEAKMWGMFLSDSNADQKEVFLRQLYTGLEELPTFDDRNLFITCDVASFLRKRGKLDEAAAIVTRVLDDPVKNEVLRGFPPTAYNFLSVLGKIRVTQGRLAEAEGLYRDAIEIAKSTRQDEDSDLLEGLSFLAQCVRAQGKHEEADAVVAERDAVVTEALERVGEKENAV